MRPRPIRYTASTTIWLLAALLLTIALRPAAAAPTAGYAEQIRTFRAARETSLRSDSGWLSLVGLFPLTVGEYSLGSAADNDLVFPASAPARIGRLRIADDSVVFEAESVSVTVLGEPERPAGTSEALLTDHVAEGPTRLHLGSLTWWIIERADGRSLRLSDTASQYLREFHGLEAFPVAPEWRCAARWIPPTPGRKVTMPTVLGTTSEQPSGGWLEFDVDGAPYRLEVPKEDGGFFVIFGDATNGADGPDATYGAGRFLWIDQPDDSAPVFIDFNRAYNPPCAFTPFATCPLPPPGNTLPFAVKAGEKAYGDH